MKFAEYFSYLLMAETLLLVAGQSLYDYGLNAGLREAVRRTGMINLNFETSENLQHHNCILDILNAYWALNARVTLLMFAFNRNPWLINY